ncbi:MAG: peptidase M23 [Bacteroidetes bacterium RIFCSPLOWO2_02_FULL_36_8]|nr:MAG: peptidase M23 [Bacteroidetes bacterium RIFCSPLOWO2_02_FULL_36_8]OFY71585.1 MAG: peptidase M23 [Bacteroidetes bacterium RIFCSPLOWO2_12_FULL_37_12]
MAKIKYFYDTDTCKYEIIRTSAGRWILNISGFIFFAFFCGFIIFLSVFYFIDSPKEALLKKENEELKNYYSELNKEMELANKMIAVLQDRDDNIYRTIFEAEPIPNSMRQGGTGGVNRYKVLIEKGLKNEKLILNTRQKIDNLKKRLYIQTKSYDEISKLAKNKSQMLISIPAIQPISNKDLTSLASGFGYRTDPIYKIQKFHEGVDFSAPKGTPVYATGNGVVIKKESSYWGYGNEIEVAHGFGYITKYAHLQAFNIIIGQRVKRGDLIGYVGSTGKSVGPHCHYEVIHNGQKVDPINYFYSDLNPDDYEKVIENASKLNQSFD